MRAPRRWRAALAALVVLGSVVTFSGADARTTPNVQPVTTAARPTGLANEGYPIPLDADEPIVPRFGIPAAQIPSATALGTNYVAYVDQAETKLTNVSLLQSKTKVSVPDATLLLYARTCALIRGANLNTCCPDTSIDKCPQSSFISFPTSSLDANFAAWFYNDGPVWVSSKNTPGAPLPFGSFPILRVSLLAFGSVPVTATVRVRQPVDARGGVEPLRFRQLIVQSGAGSIGATVDGFPDANTIDAAYFQQYLQIAGPVDIAVSDVKIDGESFDVGQRCHTRTPATLRYQSPRGWYDSQARAETLEGRPGEFQPIGISGGFTAGRLNGALDIPKFASCGDGRGNADSLISSFASGLGNYLGLSLQGNAFESCTLKLNGQLGKQDCVGFPETFTDGAGPTGTARQRSAVVHHPSRQNSSVSLATAKSLSRLKMSEQEAALTHMPASLAREVRRLLKLPGS